MRILLWAPLGAGTHYWGPGTNIYRLYKTLKEKDDIKVTLVHGSSQQGSFPEVFDEQIALPSFDKGVFNKLLFFIKGKKWLQNNYNRFDVFHGISAFETTFLFANMFYGFGKPAFVKITGEYGGFGKNSLISRLLGISNRRLKNANNITGYISISKKIKENLIKNNVSEKKIFSIPNGVDTERFSPISSESKIDLRKNLGIDNLITICYLGGLTENKRVYEIVSAINELVVEGVKIQLLIVGPDRSNGVEYEKIKPFLLNNWLHHIKFTEEPELYLKASDIYILNSKSEGMPNSLLEAMSTSLCCLSTPASGSADLIDNNINGLVLDGSKEDIVAKVRSIVRNLEDYKHLGEQARRKIENSFSSKYVLNSHLELFDQYLKFNREKFK